MNSLPKVEKLAKNQLRLYELYKEGFVGTDDKGVSGKPSFWSLKDIGVVSCVPKLILLRPRSLKDLNDLHFGPP